MAGAITSPEGWYAVSHCWSPASRATVTTACAPANVSTHGVCPKTVCAVPASRSISQRLAVVVVHREGAVRLEVVARLLQRLLGEQERLEPDLRGAAHQRQRVGQREEDQVVLLVRACQERPAVVDVPGDPRVLVGLVGVAVDADLHDPRVDVDRVDVACAPLDSAIATSEPEPAPTISTSSRGLSLIRWYGVEYCCSPCSSFHCAGAISWCGMPLTEMSTYVGVAGHGPAVVTL